MYSTPDLIVGILLFAVWSLLLLNPRWFVGALFVTSPWAGLYVTPGWELDAFKAGLVLAPVLLLRSFRPSRLRGIWWPLSLLVLYASGLTVWALATKEPLQFGASATVPYDSRVIVQYVMFLLRALLPAVVVSMAARRSDVKGWMNAYVWSMFVLSCYGIVQEFTFLSFGNYLTPIFRDGIFGDHTEFASLDIGTYHLLRVHSFSREPRDLAIFCVPALAWLFVRITMPKTEGIRATTLDRVRFLVIACCALLTFSSSLLLVIPLLVLGIEGVRPRLNLVASVRYWIRTAVAVSLVAPLLWIATESRVISRFTNKSGSFDLSGLIQPSREGPALDFLIQTWPRSFLGFGIGTQAFYLPRYMPKEFSDKVYEYGTAAGVDSLVVGTLADLGVPGLMLFALVLWRGLARSSPSQQWALRAAMVAAMVMSIPSNPAQQGSLLWLLLGAHALEKLAPKRAAEPHPTNMRQHELAVA